MISFSEYRNYDAIGLAELLKKKEVSSSELCQVAIDRIEKCNEHINAIVYKLYKDGLDLANNASLELPLGGVPFLLKDLLADYAGKPTSKGCRAFQNEPVEQDSELVKRYKEAGLVVLGKTNTPEFGLMGVTEPELFGACHNPWDLERSPGGSSGGSAAAICAGIVPMASAGDGGGSIRIPASYCGLFGLKVSRGLNPSGPVFGRIWQGAVVEHVISRSVRDSALALDLTHGPDAGNPYCIQKATQTYLSQIERPPRNLKIAFSSQSPINAYVDPQCKLAVEKTAKLLVQLGHNVEEAQPQIDGLALARSYIMMYFGELAADLQEMKDFFGREMTNTDVEEITLTFARLGQCYTAGEFVKSLRIWDQSARVMGAFHQKYDLYLTPTAAVLPPKIGELKPNIFEMGILKAVNALDLAFVMKKTGMVDKMAKDSLAKTPFTQLANLTGQPAMSVPMHWTADNLPVGVQFTAAMNNDALLLKIAAQLENANPWFGRLAPMQ